MSNITTRITPRTTPRITHRTTPRTNDLFHDELRWRKIQYEKHLKSCGKIYDQLQYLKDNEIYCYLMKFANNLVKDRMRMISERISKSLSRIWIMKNSQYTNLTIFFGTKHPIINNKTKYLKLYLNPEEDMSVLYVYGDFYQGNTLKNHQRFQTYDDLNSALSANILENLSTKKKRGNFLKKRIRSGIIKS